MEAEEAQRLVGGLALTLWQPWASLVMAGVKDVENRSWPPPSTLPEWRECDGCGLRTQPGRVRRADEHGRCGGTVHEDGPFPFRLHIHAGKVFDDAAWAWGDRSDQVQAVVRTYGGAHDHPRSAVYNNCSGCNHRGVLLGSVLVTGCHDAVECRRCACAPQPGSVCRAAGTEYEHWRGEESYCSSWAMASQFHWQVTDPLPLPDPIPMRGRQKLWRIPEGVLADA